MVSVEMSVHIDRPVAEVFAYMGDPTNVPEWNSMIEVARPSESPIRVGTRVHLRFRFLGRKKGRGPRATYPKVRAPGLSRSSRSNRAATSGSLNPSLLESFTTSRRQTSRP